MYKKCRKCNGTGKIDCEMHGSHACPDCKGRGCDREDNCSIPAREWYPPYRINPTPDRWWYDSICR